MLQAAGIRAFPVMTSSDLVSDPQVLARHVLVDVPFGEFRGTNSRVAPCERPTLSSWLVPMPRDWVNTPGRSSCQTSDLTSSGLTTWCAVAWWRQIYREVHTRFLASFPCSAGN